LGAEAYDHELRAQQYTADGLQIGSAVTVNTREIDYYAETVITALPTGGFIVVWGNDWDGPDRWDASIQAQIFGADGQKIGAEITVANGFTNDHAPRVTVLADGNVAVCWQTNFSAALGDVRFSIVKPDGTLLAANVAANTTTGGGQHSPEITALANGGFVIGWIDGASSFNPTPSAATAARAQLFDAAGVRVGGEITVSDDATVGKADITLLGLEQGGFIAAWREADAYQIRARLFDDLGGQDSPVAIISLPRIGYVADRVLKEIIESAPGVVGFVLQNNGGSGTGGTGSDVETFYWAVENADIIGTEGNDTLLGTAGDDTIKAFGGDDTINGGSGDDTIFGGLGDDTIDGDGGNDTLDGGDGTDTVTYKSATSGVTVNLGYVGQQNTSGAGIDRLTGFEILHGSAYGDVLTNSLGGQELNGLDGDDRIVSVGLGSHGLYGGNGNDTFLPGIGDDWINGGDDFDTVDYSSASGPVSSRTDTANNNTGSMGYDTLIGIERIIGTRFDDHLTAFNDGHQVWGGAGNDVLSGGFGSGQLHGGVGNDTYKIFNSANLIIEAAGEGIDHAFSWASYVLPDNVEHLTLMPHQPASDPYAGASVPSANPINGTGNPSNNVITGNLFANQLNGMGGADILSGNAGADIITGGAGNDIFRDTAAGLHGDTITDFTVGDRIIISDVSLASFSLSRAGDTLTFSGGSLTLSGLGGGKLVVRAAAEGGVEITLVSRIANDFDGDGRSDVLWRNDNGNVTDWLGTASGGFTGNFANANLTLSTDWQIAGTGDFNGDGRSDILWRNANGTVTNWLGQTNGGFVGNFDNANLALTNDWQVAGTGDFNGDGRDDVLWRNDNGTVTNWLGEANGGFAGNFANANLALSNEWQMAGTGDFNGDGRSDTLWRNANGTVTNWLGQTNGGFVGNFDNANLALTNDWQVAGTGDFNGDGRDDMLWRNDNGTVTNWLGQANGGFVGNFENANISLTNDWQIAVTGDYNGDGRDDILWRNDNGTVTNWLGQANGGFVGNFENANISLPNDWHIQPSDYPF
jgi:Ca2+-binding RTX toxin-like protein